MPKAKPSPVDERTRIVDELGQLDAEVAASDIPGKIKRIEKLRATVREWASSEPAEKPLLFEGARYQATASPRENQRKITNLKGLYRALGVAKFLEVCTLTLKAAESALSTSELDKYITEDRTGTRTIATFSKGLPS